MYIIKKRNMFVQTNSYCPQCKRKGKKRFLCESVFFQSVAPEKPYKLYIKITAKTIADRNSIPVPWILVSRGFQCPKCRFKAKEGSNPRGRIKLNDTRLLKRLCFSSFEVEKIQLYQYQTIAVYAGKKPEEKSKFIKLEKFSGTLWTTTPRIKTDVFLQSYLEAHYVDPNFIVVSKSADGMSDYRTCFLVKVSDLMNYSRKEIREPIIIT